MVFHFGADYTHDSIVTANYKKLLSAIAILTNEFYLMAFDLIYFNILSYDF